MNDPFAGLVGSFETRRSGASGTARRLGRLGPTNTDPSANWYMFLSDLQMYCLPYGRGADEGFEVRVDSDREDALSLIVQAMPSTTYIQAHLHDALQDYVRTAIRLLAEGDLAMTVEYFRAPDAGDAPPVAFRIEFADAKTVTRAWASSHYVLRKDSGRRILLDPREVAVVSLPPRLRRRLRRARAIIQASDRDLEVMERFLLTQDANAATTHFDFSTYQRVSHDIVLKATRDVGWTARGGLTEEMLDPMRVWRSLQFSRLVVQLRDAAIDALGEVINLAGKEMGFFADLHIDGLLSSGDIDKLAHDLEAGTHPIADMAFPKARS